MSEGVGDFTRLPPEMIHCTGMLPSLACRNGSSRAASVPSCPAGQGHLLLATTSVSSPFLFNPSRLSQIMFAVDLDKLGH